MTRLLIAIIIITFSTLVFATPPTNLAIDKQQVTQYVTSGQYDKDISTVTKQAQSYLATRIAQNNKLSQPKKLAIIFDIDETTLSNYPDMINLSYGGTMDTINAKEAMGDDPAIAPTLALYQYAKQNDVAVFFITGRREPARAKTVSNLNAVGYKNFDGLYLKPVKYSEKSAIPYKTAIRKKIAAQGYDIVFSMGDQPSDLAGGYADKTFLLPNPFYIVP